MSAVTGWQPIETAPREHAMTLLLFWSDNIQAEVTPGYWDDGFDCDGEAFEEPCWYRFDSYSVGEIEPTHWMPLPAAPVTA